MELKDWYYVGIPVATAIIGWIFGYLQALIPLKKKIRIEIDPLNGIFKIYNTGNKAIPFKQVGILFFSAINRKFLYKLDISKTLLVESDPMEIPYPIDDFWNKVGSNLGCDKFPNKFFCFIKDADGKIFKSKSEIILWEESEKYWEPNYSNDNVNLPF